MVCLSSYGKVHFSVSTDRTAYAPGEYINLSIKLDCPEWNELKQNVLSVTAQIKQTVELYAEGHNRSEWVMASNAQRIAEFDQPYALQVPSLPPTYRGIV